MAWRVFLLACGVALFWTTSASAQVRKWTARTGDFAVEAELVDVANDVATLKRTDGKVIKIELSKLSLGDLRYIKQALAEATGAAGDAKKKKEPPKEEMEEENPFKPAKPKREIPADKPKTAPAEPTKEPTPEPKKAEPISGPPLAKPNLTAWQGAPDPAPKENLLNEIKEVNLRFADIGTHKPFTPATYSRFIAFRESSGGSVYVHDVVRGMKFGPINPAQSSIDKIALSPDGQELTVGGGSDPNIAIYSVADGALKKKIDLKNSLNFSSYLAYASPGRLLHHNNMTKRMHVVDTATGEDIASFPVESLYDPKKLAISPGGAYLAIMPKFDSTLQLIDLRNGLVAGEFELPQSEIQSYTAMGFSPDGAEFAMVAGSLKTWLHCWDMKTGKVSVSHEFTKQLNQINSLYALHQGPVIEWFEKSRDWLVFGVALIDRKGGGPTWVKQQQAAADLPVRWLIDDERQLVFTRDSSKAKLEIEKLPVADFAKSAKLVASGGTTADLNLPPLSKFDLSTVKQPKYASTKVFNGKIPAAASKPLDPAKFASIASPRGFVSRMHVSAVGKAVVYINGGAAPKPGEPPTCYLNYVDLASGSVEKTLAVNYPADFGELSGDGGLAILLTGPEKDRIDLMKMPGGELLAAFRPYPDSQQFLAALARANFVGDNQLLSVAADGHSHLWSFPEFQGQVDFTHLGEFSAWPSPTGSHLLVHNGNRIDVLDFQQGAFVGALESPAGYEADFIIESLSFREDGGATCAIVDSPTRNNAKLVSWNLSTGKVQQSLAIPSADGVVWASPTTVLMRLRKPLMRGHIADGEIWRSRFHLIEPASGRILWKFNLPNGLSSMQIIGGKFWYVARSAFASPYALVGVPIPAPEAASLIASAPAPETIIEKGAKVSLETKVLVARDSLADKALEEKFRAKVTELLGKPGVQVVADAPPKLVANLEEKATGRQLRFTISGLPGIASGSQLVLRETILTCDMKFFQANGNEPFWTNTRVFEITQKEIDQGVPDKKTPDDHFRDPQAQKLMTWLADEAIPPKVYESWYYQGVGESELGMAGESIRVRSTIKK